MDELGISPKFKEGGGINFPASVVDEDEDEDEVTDSRMGTEMVNLAPLPSLAG